MGLLDKSNEFQDSKISKASSVREGLLARAAKLQEKNQNNSLLKKAERFREEVLDHTMQEVLETNKPEPDDDEIFSTFENTVDIPMESIQESDDLFHKWEKEAKEHASQLEIREKHGIEPEITENKYLFDDESAYATSPSEFQIASKRKVENYQSIFEITKEIANCDSYEDYFENLTFSILGQMGSESILIFSSTNGNFDTLYVMDFQGVDPEAGWNFAIGDEVYTVLKKRNDIVFARELLEKGLPEKEKKILVESKADILVPLNYKSHFFGIILLGKPLTGEEYTADDLEFMKIIAEISGSMIEKIFVSEEQQKELKHLQEVIRTNNSVFDLSRNVMNVKSMDEAFDKFLDSVKYQLFVDKFTFFVLNHENSDSYNVFASNVLSPESISNFILSAESDLVGIVSNVMGVYNLKEYLESTELKGYIKNDEIILMDEFIVLPLIYAGWLTGMFVVHSTTVPWTDSMREAALTIMEAISPVFANLLLMTEKSRVMSGSFSPVAESIESEIAKSKKLGTYFSVILVKVQNVSRSITMMGAGAFSRYCDSMRKVIRETVGDMDHTYRIGQAAYCTILHGRSKKEASIVEKKINGKIVAMGKDYDFKINPEYKIIAFPDDAADSESILEMIDEF